MKGKIAIVTGANGGLGSYVTQAFLDAGAYRGGSVAQDSADRF